MDAGVQGAVIGVGVIGFIVIVCTIRDRCQQKKVNKTPPLETQSPVIVVKKVLAKKHWSVKDFFKENTPSQLKTIRIS